jgi:hypothetical protein
MRHRRYIFAVLILVLLGGAIAPRSRAGSEPSQEYKLKAAFLYNFLKFVDWSKEKMGDANEPITLGIIGKDPFGQAFEPVKDKDVKDKKVVLKRLKGFEELKTSSAGDERQMQKYIETLRKCHLLFVCASESKSLKEILKHVKDQPVLTVGEMPGFLEAGGIMNFLMEDNKVRFEVNAAAAKHAKLKIRSQLLRLAKRVIEEKATSKSDNK